MSTTLPPIRPLADVLYKKQPLSALLSKVDVLLRREQLLHAQLAPALRPLCKVAAFHNGRLLLVVSNGQWATHLRYQERRLCNALQTLPEFAGLTRILLKVQPPPTQSRKPDPCPPPPASAAKDLHACAQDCQNPALRHVLQKLAKRAERTIP